jgi:opacity protein-like surface antigen
MVSRFAVMLSSFSILACSLSLGQESTPKIQVFGGYSLFHLDSGGLNSPGLDSTFGVPVNTIGVTSNFNGWDAQVQYNLRPMLGIAADVGGNYGPLFNAASGSSISGLPSASSYSFLFGPVVQSRTGKARPFVHGLFGVNRLGTSSTSSLVAVSRASLPSASDTAFAMALGGGVDYNLSPKFALRLGQIDYLYTGHNMNNFAADIFGPGIFSGFASHENNFRISAGVVLRF